MTSLRPVIHLLGMLIIGLAFTMLVPFMIDVVGVRSDWPAFIESFSISLGVGGLLVLASRTQVSLELDVRQIFLLTALSWLILPALAAIPLAAFGLSFTDAYFEAVSGLTTTGSTVMTGLDQLPPGILLWRSFLQWLGGVGIIVMAVALLPFMRVGGMQMFRVESSDKSGKVVPRAFEFIGWILWVYVGLTALCALVYWLLGMGSFDALNHAMTTLSTGGYSTHDASFGYFQSPALHWAGTVFMLAGALPFVAYIKFLRGNVRAIHQDSQARFLIIFLAWAALAMALWLSATSERSLIDGLRLTAFNIVSVVTTTGFATEDYTQWGSPAIGAFMILTILGGCAGSTSGGIKIYRIQIALRIVRLQILRMLSPSRVVVQRYAGERLSEEIAYAILAFLVMFLGTVALFTVVLTGLGLDLVTALSASATAIANVGPGLGHVIGPAGNFVTLPDVAKWLLSLAMLMGRLEIFVLLVFLDPDFWR